MILVVLKLIFLPMSINYISTLVYIQLIFVQNNHFQATSILYLKCLPNKATSLHYPLSMFMFDPLQAKEILTTCAEVAG